MFKRTAIIFIILTAFATIFLQGCSNENAKQGSNPITYNLQVPGKTIDPQLAQTTSSGQVLEMCIEGLTIQGQKPGEILPGGAKSWDVSKDGTVYTFHLRENAKWSNGEKLTAQDYFFGLKRGLKPSTAAVNAYMLYTIVNAKEYNDGKIKDFSKVGIKIIDDYTLAITLKNVVPYFTQLLANAIAAPCNEKFLNKVGNQYALQADTLLYNGPYSITNYIPNGKFEFKKNKYYWNKDNIKIPNWTFLMVGNGNTSSDMYQSGGIDITPIGGPQIPQYKGKKYLLTVPDGSVFYLQLNVENRFFKNKNIRKAMSMAIDRDVFCKDIMKDGSRPAYNFVPPGISGGKVDGKLITFRKRFPKKLLSLNIAEAKRLYKKGLEEIGYDEVKEGKVKVKLLSQSVPGAMRQCQYIQQQLYKNLGMNVILEPNTFQAKTAKIDQIDYEFALNGWGPNYNYPTTFMNMWVTNGGNNDTNWSNAAYDKLINTAETSSSGLTRITALYDSEILLMEDLPVIPLFYQYWNWLIRPDIKGVVTRTSGNTIGFRWCEIEK